MTQRNLLPLDNVNLDSLPIRRIEGTLATEIEGELVLLDLTSNAFIGLNSIGTAIWNNIENKITFHSLCNLLMEEFDVTEDVCRADVFSFLEQLAESNLVLLGDDAN